MSFTKELFNYIARNEIGLDIGTRTIKGLKLKKKGKSVVLDRYFFCDLSKSNDDFPMVTHLSDSLKALVEVNGFSGYLANSCINDNDVAIFDLALPQMPDSDLPAAISSEVEQLLGYPITEAIIRHTVLAREDKIKVKAFCLRTSDMTNLYDTLKKADLNVDSLDMGMLSNIAMLDFNKYLEPDAYTVIIDLGETKTSTALVHGKKLISTNIISSALGNVNARLCEAGKISYLDAEQIKNDVTNKRQEYPACQEIVESIYVDLIKDLKRSVEFFQLTTGDQPIKNIFAIGGGAQYASLLSMIQAACGIDTIVPNPFKNIQLYSKRNEKEIETIGTLAPHMGTAVGLALRRLNAA